VPVALLLPSLRNVHDFLAGIRTDLMAVRGGTAGESVALDDLKVALQATDFTGPGVFQHKTAAERVRLAVDAIAGSISVLQGQYLEKPAIQVLIDRLNAAQGMVNGLASLWLVLLE